MSLLYISERGKRLLDVLLAQTDYITMNNLAKTLDVSRRTVYYDISKINIWLEQAGMPALTIVREKGLFIPHKNREKSKVIWKTMMKKQYIYFHQKSGNVELSVILFIRMNRFIWSRYVNALM